MEVQTTERPATEAWAEEHPIRRARLVDQIAAEYPISNQQGDYCVWGAVGFWFGWRYGSVGKNKGWPCSTETIRRASNNHLDIELVYKAMHAHDSGRPAAEVWNLVDEALRAAGLC